MAVDEKVDDWLLKLMIIKPRKNRITGEIRYLAAIDYLFGDTYGNWEEIEETEAIKVLYNENIKDGK